MIVLAHRGNLDGPDAERENALQTVEAALSSGFGVETDLRFSKDGTPYISHDPSATGAAAQPADPHVALWARFPDRMIALNIKETACEQWTVSMLRRFDRMRNTVLFDMELIEPEPGEMARTFERLDEQCEIAARVSDRNESIERALALPGRYIWLDEMDGTWARREDLARLKEAGRTVLVVSRDLHRAPVEECEPRWEQMAEWGADAICTDWPLRLSNRLGLSPT